MCPRKMTKLAILSSKSRPAAAGIPQSTKSRPAAAGIPQSTDRWPLWGLKTPFSDDEGGETVGLSWSGGSKFTACDFFFFFFNNGLNAGDLFRHPLSGQL